MSKQLKKIVYIYKGEGAGSNDAQVLQSTLQKHLCSKSHSVQFITPEDTIKGIWRDSASAYAIGGGYDLGFIKRLGYHGTQQIKDYVEGGGSYLGICAGAYFACSAIEFDKGGPMQVCGERQLRFYPGLCIGPAYGPYNYYYNSGARASQISCSFPTTNPESLVIKGDSDAIQKVSSAIGKDSILTYYNGGGLFSPQTRSYVKDFEADDSMHERNEENNDSETGGGKDGKLDRQRKYKLRVIEEKSEYTSNSKDKYNIENVENLTQQNVKILAAFDEISHNPAAIVQCKVGKGIAILSSVHLEFNSACLDPHDEYLKPVIDSLRPFDEHQEIYFRKILLHLGLHVNNATGPRL